MNLDEIVKKIDPDTDYTIQQVSKMFEIANSTVLSSINRQSLKSRKIFGRHYIKGKSIINYLLDK